MMKQCFFVLMLSAVLFFSCSKKDPVRSTTSSFLVVNASPNAGGISVLQNLKSVGDYSYLTGLTKAAQYVTVDSGFNNYKIKKAATEYSNILFANSDQHFSLFVYDTLVTGKVKSFFVKDEVDSTGMGNKSKLRVVQVSPDADTLILVTPAIKDGSDSAFNGSPYYGKYSDDVIYSSVGYDEFYTGVRPVKVYSTLTKSYVRTYLFNFEKGGIYSFVFKGYLSRGGTDSLSLSVIKHN